MATVSAATSSSVGPADPQGPAGKARNGHINLVVESSNFLPLTVARPSRSGNRLKSIRVLTYKAADPNVPILRDGLTIDFTDPGRWWTLAHSPAGMYLIHREPGPVRLASRSVRALCSTGRSEVFLTLGLATLMRGVGIGQQNVVIEANGVRVAARLLRAEAKSLPSFRARHDR